MKRTKLSKLLFCSVSTDKYMPDYEDRKSSSAVINNCITDFHQNILQTELTMLVHSSKTIFYIYFLPLIKTCQYQHNKINTQNY